MGAAPHGERGEAALIGVPFDGTASFRPGARFGPGAIREGSHSLETYSPFLDRDLANRDFIDAGDLEVAPGRPEKMIDLVSQRVKSILAQDMKPIVMGGEHTITIGVVSALVEKFDRFSVLQIDAHTDYRDEYLGEKYSHATVMRRIGEMIPPERIYRIGIRSGSREELIDAGIDLPIGAEARGKDVERVINSIPEDAELYITLDLDVFDPSLVPGVGNPEPNGLTWREFIQLMRVISYRNVLGCDVTELAPQYDTTGVSAIVAASVVRELMLCIMP